MSMSSIFLFFRKASPDFDFEHPHCKECDKEMTLTPAQKWKLTNGYIKNVFCSRRCRGLNSRRRINQRCKICGAEVSRTVSEAKKSKSGHSFCSLGCAAIWSNYQVKKFKTTSKLETDILAALSNDFPDLEIHTNSNAAIGAELDLYFPTLLTGIEINGPYHYLALRGSPEKLKATIANDKRKQQMAKEAGIRLYVLNSSTARGKAAFARYYPQIKSLLERLILENAEEEVEDDTLLDVLGESNETDDDETSSI